MSISLAVLIILYIIILLCNKKMKRFFDAFFFVITPYVFIIIINNIFMSIWGFNKISDRTIWVHILCMCVFYLGSIFGQSLSKRIRIKPLIKPISIKDISYNRLFYLGIICVIFVSIGKSLLIRQYGFTSFLKAGDTLKMPSLFNHVELLLYPINILLFEQYLKTKKKRLLVIILTSCILIFSSFVKYHIISLFLCTFIYITIKYKKYIAKIGIITLLIIVLAFAGNYMINFSANNLTASSKFYINHLWMYIAGGTINIDEGLKYAESALSKTSIIAWLWQMITSFPSMFTNKLLGFRISNYAFSTTLPKFSIGISSSNVISIIGSAFIQGSYLSFLVFSFFWGWIVQAIYASIKKRGEESIGLMLAGCIFLAYNMLSFFSSFFVLSNPWETMFLAWILPKLLVSIKVTRNQPIKSF